MLFLVGQDANNDSFVIIDVVVMPTYSQKEFFNEYCNFFREKTNDELLAFYPAGEFSVNVVLEHRSGLTNTLYEDISFYLSRK
jgi:hypothetical protein